MPDIVAEMERVTDYLGREHELGPATDPTLSFSRIGPLCTLAVKLISTLSEFVDAAPAPEEVQSLSCEISSFYSSLGYVKIAIRSPQKSTTEDWHGDLQKLITDCTITLKDVESIIDAAKTTEMSSTSRRLCKTVKLSFGKKQIVASNRRIVTQNGILQLLLSALSETRGVYIEQRLEDVREKVDKLVSSREKFHVLLAEVGGGGDESGASEQDQYSTSTTFSKDMSRSIEEQGTLVTSSKSDPRDKDKNIEKALSEILGKLDGLNTVIRNEIEMGNSQEEDKEEGNLDLVAQVTKLTLPDPYELQALKMADRTWTLSMFRSKRNGEEWREILPSANQTKLRFKLKFSLFKGLTLVRISDQDEEGDRLTGFWTEGDFRREGCVISDVAPSYYAKEGYSWINAEFTFSTVQGAVDFHFCISKMVPLVYQARKVYVAASSHLTTSLQDLSPYKLQLISSHFELLY